MGQAPASGGFDVFDVLAHDGLIVVAVASVGIELWRVTPYGDPKASWPGDPKLREVYPQICTTPLSNHWAHSRDETFAYPDRKSFSVKLSLTRDGRVQADVDDLQDADKRHTRYIQVNDKWQFRVTPRE